MKRVLLVVGALAIFAGGITVGHAAATSTPEVDKANAHMELKAQPPLRSLTCTGEDGIGYVTLSGTYTGTETDVTPGSTDYSLSGSVVIKGVSWTINTATGRGYLTGAITLSSTAGGTYVGKLTLVSDGLPAAGAVIPSRGTIQASFVPADDTPATTNDDILFANVEFGLTTASAVGIFGDATGTASTPNFSVVTNLPKDGHC
jgi:hypothetical protein